MAFRASDGSFISEWYAREQEKFYSHVPVWVAVGAVACEATGRRLTHAEYNGLIELLDGMNSYTRKVLRPVLDDLAVCELASYCMSQIGRELGELDLPRDYNEAVEKELAPLLVKRLRESAGLLNMTRKYAEEWGRWRETIEHLKKTAAGQQKRADKLEQRLDDARQSILCVAEERDDARAQLRAASAELDHARREVAAWEVQCQDLRDRLTQPPDMTAVEATIEQWNAGTINRAELQAGLRAAFDRTPSSPGTLEIGSHCVVPSESTAIISANEIAAARKMS